MDLGSEYGGSVARLHPWYRARVLAQHRPSNLQLLYRKQHVQHPSPPCPCPVRLRRVPPRVVRPALDADIATLHEALLAGIENKLDLALEHDPVVNADGAVHGTEGARHHVHYADDRASRNRYAGKIGKVIRVSLDLLKKKLSASLVLGEWTNSKLTSLSLLKSAGNWFVA